MVKGLLSRKRLLVQLALILGLSGLTISLGLASELDSWDPPVNLSNSPGHSSNATLGRNPATGDAFVVWTDSGSTTQTEIVGRRWDRATQSWFPGLSLPAENFSQCRWVDDSPALFFDREGHGLLLWTRRYAASQGAPTDGTDLLWRSWGGTGWSDEAVLLHADTYLPQSYGLIPVESSDSIILFITVDQGYRLTEYQGGSWTEITPWSRLDVQLAALVMDQSGLLHAAAYGENSGQGYYDKWFDDAYYLTYDGSQWSAPVNLSSTDGVAHDTGIALDSQGRLHFLWSDPDSPYSSESSKSAIWERVYDDGTWTANTEVTAYNESQAIDSLSLTADMGGTLHLAWSEGIIVSGAHTDLDILYQTNKGTGWDSEEIVITSAASSRHPVLATGTDGASLVWQEGDVTDREVFFTHQSSPSGPCKGITAVDITGPITGSIGSQSVFSASVEPPMATVPVSYTWQAIEHPSIVHSGGLIDMVGFTWDDSGTKAITVTAENCGGTATSTHSIFIEDLRLTYLPLIIRGEIP